MRPKTELFTINGQPLLAPDAEVAVSYSDIDASDAGRDQDGVLHRNVVRYKVAAWSFQYSHLTEDDCVKDDKGSIIDNTLHIINVRYALPDTGNWGTLQLTAAGTGIVFSSAALLLLNWRRWR
jgi:hypothetical protein